MPCKTILSSVRSRSGHEIFNIPQPIGGVGGRGWRGAECAVVLDEVVGEKSERHGCDVMALEVKLRSYNASGLADIFRKPSLTADSQLIVRKPWAKTEAASWISRVE